MAKLPKSIIKKYGITKKAWQVFRSKSGSSRSIKKTKKVKTMVKRKKGSKKKSYSKNRSMKPESVILPAGVYGGLRERLSKLLAPFTSKIPLGTIADEAALGTIGYLAAKGKLGNNKMIKQVGLAALTIESARIGE